MEIDIIPTEDLNIYGTGQCTCISQLPFKNLPCLTENFTAWRDVAFFNKTYETIVDASCNYPVETTGIFNSPGFPVHWLRGKEKRGETYWDQPCAEGSWQILPITLEESPIWPEWKVILYLHAATVLLWRQWSKALNVAIINPLKEAMFAAVQAHGPCILTKIDFKSLSETEHTDCHRHRCTKCLRIACYGVLAVF